MPIGYLIGLLIGFIICGMTLAITNVGQHPRMSETSLLLRQKFYILGSVMWISSICALIGTVIELLVR